MWPVDGRLMERCMEFSVERWSLDLHSSFSKMDRGRCALRTSTPPPTETCASTSPWVWLTILHAHYVDADKYVHCMISVCSVSDLCVFSVWSLCVQCLISVCSVSDPCVSSVWSLCVQCLISVFIVWSLCVQCLIPVCPVSDLCVFSVWSLSSVSDLCVSSVWSLCV